MNSIFRLGIILLLLEKGEDVLWIQLNYIFIFSTKTNPRIKPNRE